MAEGRVALDRSERWWRVRNEVSQVYSPCGYSCTVIIKIALAPAHTCSSCPSLIQLNQEDPRVFHVCSVTAQPITVTPQEFHALPVPRSPSYHPFLGSRMKGISLSLDWVYGKEREGSGMIPNVSSVFVPCYVITTYIHENALKTKLQRSWEVVNKGFCTALWCYGKPGERTRCLICGNWETFGVWQSHPFFQFRELKD